ncbi:MAG TPA: septation protein A, partial [Rhizobacter sp.]|nr:septation protein A [Rhizobacter sp.]
MKFLLDFLPLLLFFGTFKFADANKEWAASFASNHLGFLVSGGVVGTEEAPVLLATLIVIAATLIQVVTLKLMRRKIDLMLWITLALVVVLGGATVWFHNATFIKWKPSVAFWSMGLALWASQALFGKNLLKSMIGGELKLPDAVWQRLNFAWVAFFGMMGLLNVYVAYSYSTSTWATFKVFGVYGLMIVFTVAQVLYLSKHMKDERAEPASPDKPS